VLLGDSVYEHPIVGGGEGTNEAILDGLGLGNILRDMDGNVGGVLEGRYEARKTVEKGCAGIGGDA
jgi:hypothetical protein